MKRTIRIVSSDGLKGINSRLLRRKLNINKIDDRETEVVINNEFEMDKLTDALVKYLIKTKFENKLVNEMKSKGYDKDIIDSILNNESIVKMNLVDYYRVLTEILLNEYFKVMDTINLKAFMNLNMKGFDYETMAILEVAEQGIETDQEMLGEMEYPKEMILIDEVSVALELAVKNGRVNESDYKNISLFINENYQLEMVTAQGIKYSLQGYLKHIGMDGELNLSNYDAIDLYCLFASLIVASLKTEKVSIKKEQSSFKNALIEYFMGLEHNVMLEEV